MKPYNPYEQQAPAAMAQMGQGILQAGGNIGDTWGRAYAKVGETLANKLEGAVGKIFGVMTEKEKEKKDLEAKVKGGEKLYDFIGSGLDPKLKSNFDASIAAMNADSSMSLKDKAMFWEDAKNYLIGGVNNQYRMQLQGAQDAAAMARTQAQIAAQQVAPYNEAYAKTLYGGAGSSVQPMSYQPSNPFNNPVSFTINQAHGTQ